MEIWLIAVAFIFMAIFALFIAGLKAIAIICKHGGVTIRIIREEQDTKIPTEPATVMSEEEKAAMNKYNDEQAAFLSSIRNMQKLFLSEDQMVGEDKK